MLSDPKGELVRITWDTRAQIQALAVAAGATPLRVRSARRTCAEQLSLYGIGRTYNLTSPKVTYQDGCGSWHVLGRAVDLDILDATGKQVSDCAAYTQLGVLWERLGGVWGGRFAGFGACGDAGHFEWHGGQTLASLCPAGAACTAVEAQVNLATQDPPRRFPWAMLAAGAAVGLAVGWAGRSLR